MTRAAVSGKNPNAKPCPRCGKLVGIWWSGKFAVIPKHKNEQGRPCRVSYPPLSGVAGKEKS